MANNYYSYWLLVIGWLSPPLTGGWGGGYWVGIIWLFDLSKHLSLMTYDNGQLLFTLFSVLMICTSYI
jgi:hypothetical protein